MTPNEETIIHSLRNGDFATAHELLSGMTELEKLHIRNQMSIENELEYDAWLKEKEGAPPADSMLEELKHPHDDN